MPIMMMVAMTMTKKGKMKLELKIEDEEQDAVACWHWYGLNKIHSPEVSTFRRSSNVKVPYNIFIRAGLLYPGVRPHPY